MAEEMKFELEDDAQRQLLVRALAEQAIQSPGFADASRRIAVRFSAGEMFDAFVEAMKDRHRPVEGRDER